MSAPFDLRWRVRRAEEASAEYRLLSPKTKQRVNQVLRALNGGPMAAGGKLLDQYENLWSAPAHRWRIIYEVDWEQREMTVTRIQPRDRVYRGLKPRRPPRP